MKLLMENWRKYVNEETDATGAMPPWLLKKQNRQKEAKALLESMGFSVRRELGRGAFGVVYEIENSRTGERSAAKVVSSNNKREIENYKFAMDEKAFMPKKYAKYLPDVKQFITGGESTIILMELLEPLDPQTAQELFASQDAPTASKKPARILKDPEAIAKIVEKAIANNRILDQMRLTPEQYSEITNAAVNTATELPYLDVDGLIDAVIDKLEPLFIKIDDTPAMYAEFRQWFKTSVLYYFDKQIVPVHQPEPGEEEISRDHWTGGSFEKVEDLFPEALGLMDAMKYFMQDQDWRPKDVHIQNVMARPGTNDFVIVDLGLFKRGVFQ